MLIIFDRLIYEDDEDWEEDCEDCDELFELVTLDCYEFV